MPIQDYREYYHESDGFNRRILYRGSGRGIVLMHEIYGATAEHIALGDRLAADGFAVFMPVFFGKPGIRSSALPALGRCISRDFRCLAKNDSSPITEWLRSLCREVQKRTGGPGVGAVGMCLTGGFVLSMMIDTSVLAPVICQPALPFVSPIALGDSSRRQALGVSQGDLMHAKQRHRDGLGLLGLRYETDNICPKERMDRLQSEFPKMIRIELPAAEAKHATLTFDFNQKAYDVLVNFLRTQLA